MLSNTDYNLAFMPGFTVPEIEPSVTPPQRKQKRAIAPSTK
jgi:hypothetical protein